MVEWVTEHVPIASNPAILEIGSGNGTLLFGVAEAGYSSSKMAGIDYSADAVKLAKLNAATRNAEGVSFTECDFLHEEPERLPSMAHDDPAAWDLLLDKGTYDAIALGEKDTEGSSPATHYPRRAARLLKQGGHFLITSCNFTEEELKSSFISEETGFKYHSRIQHPTFTFGGRSGSIVSSVAFEKT